MVAWPVRLAETGTGILRRRVVEAAFHGGDDGVVAVQRQRFPACPRRISSRVTGWPLCFSMKAVLLMTRPGVQKPHWTAPASTIGLLDAGKPVAHWLRPRRCGSFFRPPRRRGKYRNPRGYCRRARCTRRIRPRRSLVWSWSGLPARRTSSSEARTSKESSRALPVDGAAYGFQHEAAS